MANQYFLEFLTVAGVHFIGVASPGPDFAIVVRQSFTAGKGAALCTAWGIACAILVHVTYSLLGIGLMISQSIIAFQSLKLLAAAYLVFLGTRSLLSGAKHEPNRQQVSVEQSPRKAFFLGFFTNVLNPKATLFFLALFTAVISPSTPLLIQMLYGVWLIVATGLWFSFVALCLTRPSVQQRFLGLRSRIDQITGVVLIGLGLKLATAKR